MNRTRRATLPLALLALLGCAATDAGSAPAIDPADESAAVEWRAELLDWREAHEAQLRGADGYLTLSDLVWLSPGDNTVGSDPGCALVLAGDGLPGRLGVLRLAGGQVSLELDADLSPDVLARVSVMPPPEVVADGGPAGEPRGHAAGTMHLDSDADGAPHRIRVGRRTFWVIDRAGQLGIRVRDPDSPVLASFTGSRWFTPDARWRVRARFEPHAEAVGVDVPNVLGTSYDDVSPGVLHFEHDGRSVTLHPTGADAEHMSIIFGDATNGRTTYGGGRFLSVPAPDADGTLWLDFNRTYNPPCAFSPYTTCPLPPPGNRLPFAVDAGERAPTASD